MYVANDHLFVLQCEHPHRPPDWRWQRAHHLADKPDCPVALANADLGVAQALLLVQDLAQPSADMTPSPSAHRAAYEIYSGSDRLRRWEIEAYLLTREPLERIAARCGVPGDVLAVYGEV